MRRMMGLAAVLAATGMAGAQTARTSPDQIVCAMSGSCAGGTAGAAQRIPVGQEKSFSLVRPDAGRAAAATSTTPAAAPRPARRVAVATGGRAVAAQVHARPNSGHIEMQVAFPNGSAELTPAGKQEVRSFATAMAAPSLADMRFAVEGHTNAVGNRDYNLDLSRRRAQTVVDYLVSLGADRARLAPEGFGFDKPRPGVAPRSAANRRVEFVKAG